MRLAFQQRYHYVYDTVELSRCGLRRGRAQVEQVKLLEAEGGRRADKSDGDGAPRRLSQ